MKPNNPISAEQLFGQLHWRYATKQFDPDRKIDAHTWAALEEALTLSASSGGLQPWAFIVITDPNIRARLAPASFGQPQITAASHLIVFAARTDLTEADVDAHIARTADVQGVSVESLARFRASLVGGLVQAKNAAERRAWAAKQTGIALGHFLASAAMLGVDACPMEGFLPPQYDEILDLGAKGFTSVSLCTVGYRAPGDTYAARPKVRFPKDRIIFHV
jgi:nitroreductase